MSFLAPQYLPVASESTPITIQSTAEGFKNVFSNPSEHMEYLFNPYVTPYRSNMNCSTGVVTVDNQCACANSASGTPFRNATPLFANPTNRLFAPYEPQLFGPPNLTVSYLVQQRSPGACKYNNLDEQPLTRCSNFNCS